MSHYTAFDSTCDFDALLAIIINTRIPAFTPKLKTYSRSLLLKLRPILTDLYDDPWEEEDDIILINEMETLVDSIELTGTFGDTDDIHDQEIKPTATLSTHEEVLALYQVLTNDPRAAMLAKTRLNLYPEVLEPFAQTDVEMAGTVMTDEKIEMKIQHQPRYLPLKGYCENNTTHICTLGVVRMTNTQTTGIFVQMILEKENIVGANEVHFPFELTRQIISVMKEAQALVEKFKDNDNDFYDCLTPRMFARKLFESKFWIRFVLIEIGGKEVLKLKEHSIHNKERMVNVPVEHLSDIILKLEEIAELCLEQFGCEEDTVKYENQKLTNEILSKRYASETEIKSFYEQGGNLSNLLENVYETKDIGRLLKICTRATGFTSLSHYIVQTFNRSLYDFAKLLIIAVEMGDFDLIALLLSHIEDMDSIDYKEILTYGYARNGIPFYIDTINRSKSIYAVIFSQQFTDFILSCCTAKTFKIIAHNTVKPMFSFNSYQREQITTWDAVFPKYLLRSEKECIAYLLPRHEMPNFPTFPILDGISNENVLKILRSILDNQRHLKNNYHLLSVVVGQVSYISWITCVTQLEWDTVLLSASTSSNYFMVNYILQNQDYRLLKIEEAFISACKAGADVEVIVMLLESFDCNLSLIIEALNYLCQCIPSNKRSLTLMLDILITKPENVEIALSIAFCETKNDVITTVIEFVNLETINMEGVFSFVCPNGKKETVKHMLSEYDHNLFDIEAALFSASLSHKYENVRVILENVNISKLNFEYLVGCLTDKNALNVDLIDIIMKTSLKPLEKVFIKKSLEHSPLHFRQICNMFDWSNKDTCWMLMKACSYQNLDNVKWLIKKNFNNINEMLIVQCINRAIALGQFHIAKWLITSPGKGHLPVIATEIAEISIYNIQSLNSLKIRRNRQMSQGYFTELRKLMKDEHRHIEKMTADLFPAEVTTTVMALIMARLDSFGREMIDINKVRSDLGIYKTEDVLYKRCRRIDWTLNGRFVDVSMDRRLENRCNCNAWKQKLGPKGSGMKDQIPARMNMTEYLVHLKQTIDHGISDTAYIEIFRNAVANGDDLCCRLLLKADKEQLPNRMLELGISESMFYCTVLSDTQRSDHFRNISSAFAWELTRRFYQEHKHDMKFKRLYPATKCGCKEKGHNSFCSNSLVLVVEVNKRYPEMEKFFGGFAVKQLYGNQTSSRISKKLNKFGDLALKRVKQSIFINHGVSFDLAEHLLKKHSNIVALVPSILRSVDNNMYGYQVVMEECVSFYCHLKGYIPFGEAHFPKKVVACNKEHPTDIVKGSFELASQVLKVGDRVETNRSAGTLGGFLCYYSDNCFLTCAHVVCDPKSLISRSFNRFHNTKIDLYVKDNNDQKSKCGSVVRCVFHEGSNDQAGIDAAVVKCETSNIALKDDQFVTDSSGNLQHYKFLGLKSPYLNDERNIVDYELLTITKARIQTMAFGSQIKIENIYTDFHQEDQIEIELNGIGPLAGNVNGMNIFPMMIRSPAHFQQVAACASNPKFEFRKYNQMCLNIPLQAGDSGTCIYIHNNSNQQGASTSNGNTSGCVGMAIAFLGGMSVVTPMKSIVRKLCDT